MQPPLFFTSGTAGVVALSGSTETVIATLNGVCTPMGATQNVTLRGTTLLTSGSTTTAVVLRIRRASLTGTLVGDQTGQTTITAAADTNLYDANAQDAPGDVTGFTYVLTAQQTGGGSGGTTVYARLDAFVW